MTGFQVVNIHLDHLTIIRHQAIDLSFLIRCLRIDRSRKALGNQGTKSVHSLPIGCSQLPAVFVAADYEQKTGKTIFYLPKNGERFNAIFFNARRIMDYYDYHGAIISSSSGSTGNSTIDRETGRDLQKIPSILERYFRIAEGLDD